MSGLAVKKPRLTKGKRTVFNADHFVPLVVPGLSTSSRGISSSTSTSQDLSSTRPAQEGSDEERCRSSSKTQNKNTKRDDSRDAD